MTINYAAASIGTVRDGAPNRLTVDYLQLLVWVTRRLHRVIGSGLLLERLQLRSLLLLKSHLLLLVDDALLDDRIDLFNCSARVIR